MRVLTESPLTEAETWATRLRENRGRRRARLAWWVAEYLKSAPTKDLTRHGRQVALLLYHLPEDAVLACYASRDSKDRARFWMRVEKAVARARCGPEGPIG